MGNIFSGTNVTAPNVDQAPVVIDSARHPFATMFLLCLQAKSKIAYEEEWAAVQIELLKFANEHKRILVKECPKEYCAFARCTPPPSSVLSSGLLPDETDQQNSEVDALKFVVKKLFPVANTSQCKRVLWSTLLLFFHHHTLALSISRVKQCLKKKTIEFFNESFSSEWKEQLVEMSRVVWPNISVIEEHNLDFADTDEGE